MCTERGRTRRQVAIALSIAASLALGACGGGTQQHEDTTAAQATPPPPPPATRAQARGDASVSARVGRLGGSLELANGARLEIDEGALSEEVEVTLSAGPAAHVFYITENQAPLGPLSETTAVQVSRTRTIHYSIPFPRLPEGYSESDLALAIEEEGEQREHFSSGTLTHWQMYPARHVGDRLVSDLDGLQGHRLQFGVSR
jgi:hypothetical protein